MFNHLTYRICLKDDYNAFKQLQQLGETLISNPAEAHLYDDLEMLMSTLTGKKDFVLFGAFDEDHTHMAAGMSMYNLYANNECNYYCAEEFGINSDTQQDILFTNFMAVSYLYSRCEAVQEIAKYVYRWAKRRNVGYIVGTFPNRVRGKIADMFSDHEIKFSAPFIRETSKGESIVCMHFCVEVK